MDLADQENESTILANLSCLEALKSQFCLLTSLQHHQVNTQQIQSVFSFTRSWISAQKFSLLPDCWAAPPRNIAKTLRTGSKPVTRATVVFSLQVENL